MVFKPFQLKIADLPQIIEIEMHPNALQSEVDEMVESICSQVVYNSRSAEYEQSVPDPKVEVIERKGDTVKLKIAV
jgi:hypothetical protein